jgi:hypothetical protein
MAFDDQHAPHTRRLLPPVQVLSLVCLLFASIAVLAPTGPLSAAPASVALAYAGVVPLVAALWILRSRARSWRARATASMVVALLLLPVAMLGALGFTIPVLLLAVALVVTDIGLRTGFAAAVTAGAVATVLHLTSGNGVFIGVMNALPVVVPAASGSARTAVRRRTRSGSRRMQRDSK